MSQSKVTINVQQLIELLGNARGAHPITITMSTEPKMNKFAREKDADDNRVPNPYMGDVQKDSRVNVFANVVYANQVNNQRGREDKEANFVPSETYGVHVTNTLVFHINGRKFTEEEKKIISGRPLNSLDPNFVYVQYNPRHFLDSEWRLKSTGETIGVETLMDYLPPRSSSTRQGTDTEIEVRRVKLVNITKVVMNRTEYTVK